MVRAVIETLLDKAVVVSSGVVKDFGLRFDEKVWTILLSKVNFILPEARVQIKLTALIILK